MDVVKVALGSRRITVEGERQFTKDRKECNDLVLHSNFCFLLCCFGPPSNTLLAYHQ